MNITNWACLISKPNCQGRIARLLIVSAQLCMHNIDDMYLPYQDKTASSGASLYALRKSHQEKRKSEKKKVEGGRWSGPLSKVSREISFGNTDP